MAILHQATLTPSKDELVQPWLRRQPWGDERQRKPLGSFRLDDPEGEVGVEFFLYGGDDVSVLLVPLTYRAAPLAGADEHLLGTMEHSVLGTRWVYDGAADPVFETTVLGVIRDGGQHAVLEVHASDGTVSVRGATAWARGVDGGEIGALPAVTVVRQVGTAGIAGPRLEGGLVGQPAATLVSVGAR